MRNLLSSVEIHDDALTVRHDWIGQVPRQGSVLWVTTVSIGDGQRSRQLGYKLVDGSFSAHFVFDFQTARQENLRMEATLQPESLLLQFPSAAVADLGDGWTWKSMLCVDGTDVGAGLQWSYDDGEGGSLG
jgi:hypothetical protein